MDQLDNGGWTRLRNIGDLDDNMNGDDWDHCFNMSVKSHLWLMLDETEGVFTTTASLAGIKVSRSSFVRPDFLNNTNRYHSLMLG